MHRLLLPIVLVASLFAFTSSARSQTHFVAFLEGTEEDATFQVPAHGYAHLVLNKEHTEISYMVNVWKTTEINPIAHFHTGERRFNGPVRKHLTLDSGIIATGVWKTTDDEDPLTSEWIDSLFAGKLYVNAHTLNNPGGELRGQFFQPEAYWTFATAQEEMPDPGKDTLIGGGAAIFIRDPLNNTLYYRATANGLSSAPTMAHIHKGAVGEIGAPVKNTNVDVSTITTSGYWTSEGEQPFTSEQYDALKNGELYWNIHTGLHGAGELRGQIRKPAGYLFTALLSGPSEEIGSGGEGTAILHLNPEMTELSVVVAAAGMTGPITNGHIHVGPPLKDGPPVVPTPSTPFGLALTWRSSDVDRPLTSEDVSALFAGSYYVNIHTQKYPAGELRGQIVPLGQEPGTSKVHQLVKTGEIALAATKNPVNDITQINYELPYPMRVELSLIDVTGKKVWRNIESGDKGMNSLNLDVRDLSNGSYLLQLVGGGESAAMTIVVTK
jgi:trimeric autotransporter adhesin